VTTLPRTRRYGTDVLLWLAGLELLPHRWRPALLRRAGVSVGGGSLIMAGLRFTQGKGTVAIGSTVFINRGCYIDANADVVIADGVLVGDHVRLLTGTHEIGTAQRRGGQSLARPVRVGSGSWLGSGACVLPGVSIGPGCVVAAGAVVTQDCEPDGLYAGAPARRVRDLT